MKVRKNYSIGDACDNCCMAGDDFKMSEQTPKIQIEFFIQESSMFICTLNHILEGLAGGGRQMLVKERFAAFAGLHQSRVQRNGAQEGHLEFRGHGSSAA
jgi:hypothetical protein